MEEILDVTERTHPFPSPAALIQVAQKKAQDTR